MRHGPAIVYVPLLIATLVAAFWSCSSHRIPDMVVDEPLPVAPLIIPLDTLLPAYQGIYNKRLISAFYGTTGQHPVWHRSRPAADSLLAFIRDIRYFGLRPQDYHLQEIAAITDPVRRDLLLTDGFLEAVRHIGSGKLRQGPTKDDSLYIALLRNSIENLRVREALVSEEPSFAGYLALKEGLRSLLDSAMTEVRDSLVEGRTHGTSPLYKRIQAVEINLERWRWERMPFGNHHIFVNIPSFTVRVMRDGFAVLESRAIVGKPQKPSPVLSSTIQCFVTYPYWHVPRRISVEDFLPMIQKDTTFITRNNFEVLDRKGKVLDARALDWSKFHKNNFPVVLRQREGPENAMGVVKFLFDNPFAVYLHDTNAPRLFDNEMRALSHGCIRVEKAVALAHYLVTNEIDKLSPRVEKLLGERSRQTIDLAQAVPVHLRYFTVEAKGSNLYYFGDIYHTDEALVKSFYRSESPRFY